MEPDATAPILVVDDDPKIVSLVRTYLEREMLLELDGLALMRIVRERSDVPVVMLSAKGSVADRVYGIHEGGGRLPGQTLLPG